MERRRTIVSSALIAIACGSLREGDQSPQSLGNTGSTSEATDFESSAEDPTSLPTTAETIDPETTSSDTADPGPLCGNSVLDAGEVCDDGNDLDGDGCNVDRRPSGGLVFEYIFNPAPLGNEVIRDLDHAADGTYVVGGYVTGTGLDAWVARLTRRRPAPERLGILRGAGRDARHGNAGVAARHASAAGADPLGPRVRSCG